MIALSASQTYSKLCVGEHALPVIEPHSQALVRLDWANMSELWVIEPH